MFLVQFQPKQSKICCLGVQIVERKNQLDELDEFSLGLVESLHGLGESVEQTTTNFDFSANFASITRKQA